MHIWPPPSRSKAGWTRTRLPGGTNMFLLLHPTTDFHGSFWNLTMCLKSALFFFFFVGQNWGKEWVREKTGLKILFGFFQTPHPGILENSICKILQFCHCCSIKTQISRHKLVVFYFDPVNSFIHADSCIFFNSECTHFQLCIFWSPRRTDNTLGSHLASGG